MTQPAHVESGEPREGHPLGPNPIRRLFYASALEEADRITLDQARGVDGLTEEVALLRVHLRDVIMQRPHDARLIETCVRALVQALLAEHRLSGQEATDIADAFAALRTYMHELLGVASDE